MKKEAPKYGRWTYVAFIGLNLTLFGPALWIIYTTRNQFSPNIWAVLAFGMIIVAKLASDSLENRIIEERDITELVLEDDD